MNLSLGKVLLIIWFVVAMVAYFWWHKLPEPTKSWVQIGAFLLSGGMGWLAAMIDHGRSHP